MVRKRRLTSETHGRNDERAEPGQQSAKRGTELARAGMPLPIAWDWILAGARLRAHFTLPTRTREDYIRAMASDHIVFDRALVHRRRVRHGADLPRHEFLLRHVAEDLAWRLSVISRRFPIVVDLGAHHGVLARALAGLPGVEVMIHLDRSAALLEAIGGLRVVADEEVLPLKSRSVDLVVSALALQTVNDLPGTLVQIERSLKPDGLFLGALLGGATLRELREALVVAETETTGGASPRVAPFADVRDLGALLQRAGFALPVADSDTIEVAYGSALELMRDLRGMGWSNALAERSRRPLRRDTLARAVEVYADRFARPDGRIVATFEVVTLTGWSPAATQQQPLRPGSAQTRLADALQTREQPAGESAAAGPVGSSIGSGARHPGDTEPPKDE